MAQKLNDNNALARRYQAGVKNRFLADTGGRWLSFSLRRRRDQVGVGRSRIAYRGPMEEQPYLAGKKQGHAIERGSFVLDLYRLICMVSASRDVARRGLTAPAIAMMQGGFFKSEVTRILISCAAGLRIQFDQSQGPTDEQRSDCGKLFQNWATDPKTVEVLTLREACNKIIHATDIRFDVVVPDAAMNPDEEGAYYQPRLYLYGSKGRNDWRAELSLIDFARRGAVAFKWLAY